MPARPILLFVAFGAIALAIVLAAAPELGRTSDIRPVDTPRPDRERRVLRIGSVSLQLRTDTLRYRAFADALATRLPAVDAAEVVILSDIEGMANALADGRVDVYLDSPLTVARVHRSTPVVPIAVRHKDGVREYASVIFSRADGNVGSIHDLPGSRIVFTEEFSTSGFLLPASLLVDRGIHLRELPPEALPGAENVAFGFSLDDETSLVWVLSGRAAAAALGEPQFERLAGSQRDELRVIARSETLPRQIVCVRSDLDTDLRRAIAETLMTIADDARFARAMAEFGRTTGFSPLRDHEFERVLAIEARTTELLVR